ncbi:MarR family transcriptional regulator [Dactylosporangium sp. NPDC050588]|uniref:Putative MarR-family protein regulatory protein n=1 Tax=Dactylosporangium aurantiacum subsp. hamdenensis TaxID=703577 RepID=E9LIQ6_9ACTN|nr:putative MarR-family protein regulatory protein [Dactylosporangium aurantiacum subsp. hamdenensis]
MTARRPARGWLDHDQQRAWLAYIRLQLRLSYEINRQLQADHELSLSDYDVLTALSVAPASCLAVSTLATQLGWERSRLSHHARRMAARGLVSLDPALADRRVTEVSLTTAGRHALEAAAPGHVDLVHDLFFDGLPAHLLAPFSEALEHIYDNVLARGTLPRPEIRS